MLSGHVVAQLRHCATSQNVTGSIPDGVIAIKLKRIVIVGIINLLKKKCRPLYLKTQSVPRSKHFSYEL
jgi:hypothetical protein